jgi:hypothetical protein
MVNFLILLKDIILYYISIIYFYLSNMDIQSVENMKKRKQINEIIKIVKQIFKDSNQEENLYRNIICYLFGDFIQVRFRFDNLNYFYFFKDDILSSKTLLKYFQNFEQTGNYIYRMDINYNKEYFNSIVNYLIYNKNKDNIGTLIYNSKSWLYLKDKDEYNNQLLLQYNFYKLKQFRKYVSFFKIKVLDFKVSAFIDIINLTLNVNIHENIGQPLHKII